MYSETGASNACWQQERTHQAMVDRTSHAETSCPSDCCVQLMAGKAQLTSEKLLKTEVLKLWHDKSTITIVWKWMKN